MRPGKIQIYVGSIAALALVASATQDWAGIGALGTDDFAGFLVLLFLGLVAESLTLPITIGRTSGSTSSIGFLPLLASLLLFGPAPTVLFMAITGMVGEFVIRKKPVIKAVFNSSQYVLSTALAGQVYSGLGGMGLALQEGAFTPGLFGQLVAFGGFGLVFVVLNNAAVSIAVAISEETPFRKVWFKAIGRTGTNLLYDIAISPIAIAVAFLYVELQWVGLLLVLLPLLFIRQAYLTIVQLQRANRDLLTALVKAIETRDPYTSGHSLRVASLAVRIAEAMGLSPSRVQNVEMAALLHDIGKIEAVYSEILRKPSDLTEEERKVIESHVTKGVELLEQLSSFSKDVIAGVQCHHERVDGKGYPLGLKGRQIPVGGRIIKVCDAIDAMLSDRPYRKALSLAQVKEQLVIYSGTQFDLEVVRAAIEGDLLESHQKEAQETRQPDSLSGLSPRQLQSPSAEPPRPEKGHSPIGSVGRRTP